MGTLIENQRHWSAYDWRQGGDEWSEVWGGSESLWWGTLFPRVRHYLPAGTLLEIAPGYGRFTRFLKDHCERLIGVDLTARCVEACRERFAGDPRLSFHVNDGTSLPMVEDRAVDFAFSFDSLVHAEAEVVTAYLGELARVLRPDGAAVLHHSNVAALRAAGVEFENLHWRAESVSAALVAEACERAGLACIGQEIVNWGREELTDCFSVITPRGSRHERPPVRLDNPSFMAEACRQADLARVYGPSPASAHSR
jgi:SAM-dependent methyltransferase